MRQVVTDTQAFTVRCPRCGALPRRRCSRQGDTARWVYPDGRRAYASSEGARRVAELAGTPLVRLHNERRERYRRVRPDRSASRRPVPPPAPVEHPALRSLRAFDGAEHQRMHEWLRHGGGRLLMGGQDV